MSTCDWAFWFRFTVEAVPTTLLNTITRLTEWAVVHPYGSFAFTMFLDQYILDTSEKEEWDGLTYLWLVSFFFYWIWEAIEWILFLLGWIWFEETLYKKMFDMLQDSIGGLMYILIRLILGAAKWKHTTWFTKTPAIINRLFQFFAATMSCLFLVRNTCLPFNEGGFVYFFNTVPIGYYAFIIAMILLIYLDTKRSIHVFPENEHYIKKMMMLNYAYFLALTLTNVLWSWSIYVTTWVSAAVLAFIFYVKMDDIRLHLHNMFDHTIIEEKMFKAKIIDKYY